MILDKLTIYCLDFFLKRPRNTTDVEKFDDYRIANKIMRQWLEENNGR